MTDTCGCCLGIERLTPIRIFNRPGLSSLSYRIGTHASFLSTMKAALTEHFLELQLIEVEGSQTAVTLRPLYNLTTREASDPAIAMLDAWATVADVLTFYQERIANEGFLRTAGERHSILELARLVGYRLRPGVAASVFLGFTLEDDSEVEIAAGTRAQSMPEPGGLPQSFETMEPLPARSQWSLLKARSTRPQLITPTTETLYLKGTLTNLRPNDPLLVFNSYGDRSLKRAFKIEPDSEGDYTKVTLTATTDTATVAPNLERYLKRLERLLKIMPEEEGPYSVAIGAKSLEQTREMVKGVVAHARASRQLPRRLLSRLKAETSRLDQDRRILTTLKLNVLAAWIESVHHQLRALLSRLETIPPRSEPEETLSNTENLAQAIEAFMAAEVDPDKSSKPHAKFAAAELASIKKQLHSLATAINHADNKIDVLEATEMALALLKVLKDFYSGFGLVELVEQIAALIAALEDALPDDPDDPTVPEESDTQTSATISEDLLGRLTIAPPVLPLSNLHLSRPLQTVFSRGADSSLQLLTGFYPSIKKKLYPVLRQNEIEGSVSVIPPKVFALRTTASLFGHNAPRQVPPPSDWIDSNGDGRNDTPPAWGSWPDWATAEEPGRLFLDNAYSEILSGSHIVVERPNLPGRTNQPPQIIEGVEARVTSRLAYSLSGKATEITLPVSMTWFNSDLSIDDVRQTIVYAQSEELELAEAPITDDVSGSSIELDGLYEGIELGRHIIISGERTDIYGVSGITDSELAMVAGVNHDIQKVAVDNQVDIESLFFDNQVTEDNNDIELPGDTRHTLLSLSNELAYRYKRDTVTIHANVVKATHGETRKEEILGSGDGNQALQSFSLSQSPLTFLAAATPSGASSTLEARVNGLLWHEATALHDLEPTSRGFITETDNEGKTTLVFGDGEHGARLPTGPENLKATYRFGIGKEGNVDTEKISILATRPLGVKEVINPLPASGGADPESRDQARRNAPVAVMALDRLVSVQDYADFTRAYAGIGKASAALLSDGNRQLVHITIAGADDIPIETSSELYIHLCQSLHSYGDPYQPLQVSQRKLKLLVIKAGVMLLPDYQWESVEPEIRSTLLETLSFESRDLGQDAFCSDVICAIQSVAGVSYVDLDTFDAVAEGISIDELEGLADTLERKERITVETDRVEEVVIEEGSEDTVERLVRPAQLAFLSPDIKETLILAELTS
jgi:hypothetical protein